MLTIHRFEKTWLWVPKSGRSLHAWNEVCRPLEQGLCGLREETTSPIVGWARVMNTWPPSSTASATKHWQKPPDKCNAIFDMAKPAVFRNPYTFYKQILLRIKYALLDKCTFFNLKKLPCSWASLKYTQTPVRDEKNQVCIFKLQPPVFFMAWEIPTLKSRFLPSKTTPFGRTLMSIVLKFLFQGWRFVGKSDLRCCCQHSLPAI